MRVEFFANQSPKNKLGVSFKGKKNKRSDDYYAYMSYKSSGIVKTSIFAGTVIGAVAARKNFRSDVIPKIFQYVGTVTLGLFGLASAQYAFIQNKK
jgi:hypothetical protein